MVTISDTDSLISDLQTLLTHPHTTPTVAFPQKSLSLPPQILAARSIYFRTLLSSRWYKPHLTKPNTTHVLFQDILEFLVTGCVSLSSNRDAISHNVRLAFLAHELLVHELEHVLAQHISNTLSRHTIIEYLNSLSSPLPPIDSVITNFLSTNTNLLQSLPHAHETVKQVCRLLSHSPNLSNEAYTHLARYITTSRIDLESLTIHPNLQNFLLTFPTSIFIKHFESPLFTKAQLLHKYRTEALVPQPTTKPPPTTRLLYESPHPHARPARLEDTVRHVRLPRGWYAKLIFDKRSSLAGGAELAFYLDDPVFGTHPCKFLVGRSFETCFILPSHQFWFAFASTEVSPEEGGVFECRWGWRFFVEYCSPEIDYAR